MDETAGRRRAVRPQDAPADESHLRYFTLVAAIFVAAVVITQRLSLGGALWFAQAVDVVAAPMTLCAVAVAFAFPGIGNLALRSVAWLAARRRPILMFALGTLPVLVVGAVFAVGTIPISADELVPIWQARLFSQFELTAHYSPVIIDHVIPPVSQGVFVLVSPEGEAISVYWPGQALLLTPFVALGIPWIIGPLFGASAIFLMGRIAEQLRGRSAGIAAMVLAVASGQFLLVAMTPYPEGVHLALTAAFVLFFISGRSRDFFLAGLIGGLALALKNPFPHFVFALPWLVWLVVSPARRPSMIPLAVGYAPGLMLIAGWAVLQNQVVPPAANGDAELWLSKLSELIQPPSALSVVLRFSELLSIWSWSAPGLILLAALGWFRTSDVRLRLLGVSFALTVVGYLFFPDQQGLGYGARYFHPAWIALPILGAAALSTFHTAVVPRFTFATCLLGLVLVLPFQLFYAHEHQNRRQAPTRALAGPGVDLFFIRFYGQNGVSETVLVNDFPDGDEIVLVSQGRTNDQQVVDIFFPGSRLVTENEWGRGYARPDE